MHKLWMHCGHDVLLPSLTGLALKVNSSYSCGNLVSSHDVL